MRTIRAIAVAAATIMLLCAAGSVAADPAPPAVNASAVERGAYLAAMGDCASCHTRPGGAPFAGGEALNSPFGPLYVPNITPDPVFGIGAWSDEQFYRAMHDGVGKDGEFLYPAFPYPWFTRVTRDDVLAIRAWLNTLPPSAEKSRPNRLVFPFGVRAGLGAWNALYFRAGAFKPAQSKSAEWNRGAYLVQGLGHCGECHTPKGAAMQPLPAKALSGGAIDDWYAPNITSDPERGIGKWTEDQLVQYFKTGALPGKGVAVGPMAQVIRESLSQIADSDLGAIAVFLKATAPIKDYRPEKPSEETGPHAAGAAAYIDHCAFCHQRDGAGRPGAVPALAGNGAVLAKGPENVIRVVLGGRLATGTFAPMPAVGAQMTDREIADVVDYARTAWKNGAPVIRQTGLVGRIRSETVTGLAGPGAVVKGDDRCRIGPQDTPVPTIDDSEIREMLSRMTNGTMIATIPSLIARVRAIAPDKPQADIVNGLMLAYCRVESMKPGFDKPAGRDRLNRLGQLVYSELATGGHE